MPITKLRSSELQVFRRLLLLPPLLLLAEVLEVAVEVEEDVEVYYCQPCLCHHRSDSVGASFFGGRGGIIVHYISVFWLPPTPGSDSHTSIIKY